MLLRVAPDRWEELKTLFTEECRNLTAKSPVRRPIAANGKQGLLTLSQPRGSPQITQKMSSPQTARTSSNPLIQKAIINLQSWR